MCTCMRSGLAGVGCHSACGDVAALYRAPALASRAPSLAHTSLPQINLFTLDAQSVFTFKNVNLINLGWWRNLTAPVTRVDPYFSMHLQGPLWAPNRFTRWAPTHPPACLPTHPQARARAVFGWHASAGVACVVRPARASRGSGCVL